MTFVWAILLLSIGAILYPYAIYPPLLRLLLWRRGRPLVYSLRPEFSVSVLLSVYNEEEVIERKVRNFLETSPAPLEAELIIVSDGSTDRTEEIVRAMDSPRVRLIRQERAGKTTALNLAAQLAQGEILVFTDANTMFLPDTLDRLTALFADPGVGLVSGQAVSRNVKEEGEGMYQRFERRLKEWEGRLGFVAGADGALYALRANLYEPLEPSLINDLFHPVQLALKGYRSVFEPFARALEPAENDPDREFGRQKRMAGQAYGVLCRAVPLLLWKGRLLPLWILLSHKAARWLHTPLLAVALACLVILSGSEPPGVVAAWTVLSAFLLALALGRLRRPRGAAGRYFRLLDEFERVHLAYLAGIVSFVRGNAAIVWNPRGGARSA